jgi:hypothetical protein
MKRFAHRLALKKKFVLVMPPTQKFQQIIFFGRQTFFSPKFQDFCALYADFSTFRKNKIIYLPTHKILYGHVTANQQYFKGGHNTA